MSTEENYMHLKSRCTIALFFTFWVSHLYIYKIYIHYYACVPSPLISTNCLFWGVLVVGFPYCSCNLLMHAFHKIFNGNGMQRKYILTKMVVWKCQERSLTTIPPMIHEDQPEIKLGFSWQTKTARQFLIFPRRRNFGHSCLLFCFFLAALLLSTNWMVIELIFVK